MLSRKVRTVVEVVLLGAKDQPVSASKYAVTILNDNIILTFRSNFTGVVMLRI